MLGRSAPYYYRRIGVTVVSNFLVDSHLGSPFAVCFYDPEPSLCLSCGSSKCVAKGNVVIKHTNLGSSGSFFVGKTLVLRLA